MLQSLRAEITTIVIAKSAFSAIVSKFAAGGS